MFSTGKCYREAFICQVWFLWGSTINFLLTTQNQFHYSFAVFHQHTLDNKAYKGNLNNFLIQHFSKLCIYETTYRNSISYKHKIINDNKTVKNKTRERERHPQAALMNSDGDVQTCRSKVTQITTTVYKTSHNVINISKWMFPTTQNHGTESWGCSDTLRLIRVVKCGVSNQTAHCLTHTDNVTSTFHFSFKCDSYSLWSVLAVDLPWLVWRITKGSGSLNGCTWWWKIGHQPEVLTDTKADVSLRGRYRANYYLVTLATLAHCRRLAQHRNYTTGKTRREAPVTLYTRGESNGEVIYTCGHWGGNKWFKKSGIFHLFK